MPTGYTAGIKDGMTFEEYAWGCAKAFGALIEMRDKPSDAEIPEKFEISDHHKDALEKATKELEEFNKLSDSEIVKLADEDYASQTKYFREKIEEERELEKKYNDMLEEIEAWVKPSGDFREFKKFMQTQIEDSIKFDCAGDYYKKELAKYEKQTVEDFKTEQIRGLQWSIDYHYENLHKEVERVDGRNEWVQALRDSLK